MKKISLSHFSTDHFLWDFIYHRVKLTQHTQLLSPLPYGRPPPQESLHELLMKNGSNKLRVPALVSDKTLGQRFLWELILMDEPAMREASGFCVDP